MRNYMMHTLLILTMGIFVQCYFSTKPNDTGSGSVSAVKSETPDPKGLLLLKRYCYACHDPQAPSHAAILAPPMEAVKFRYKLQDSERAQFVQSMVDFVKAPANDNALMFGAVSKFGLMTKLALPDSTLQTIGEYVYDHELEKPVWFDEHFSKQDRPPNGGSN